MGYGESQTVDALNNYFTTNKIHGIAYRNKQSRFAAQLTDINCDSNNSMWYLALEVKMKRGKHALNYKSDFTEDINGVHQLDRLIEYANLSGRIPYVILYCRNGRGKSNDIYVFDARFLHEEMHGGYKSILAKDFDAINMNDSRLYKVITNG